MAIQVRRGLKADFDQTKMLPGEWAVSIDSDTTKQVVWMCFSPGVVKKMATITDMLDQIASATDDIKQQYIAAFNGILTEIESKRSEVSTNTVYVGSFKTLLENTYIPRLELDVTNSSNNVISAKSWAIGTTGTRTGENTNNAKYFSEQAKNSSDNADISKENALLYSQQALDYKNQAKQISGLTTILNDTTPSTSQTYSSSKFEERLSSDISNQISTVDSSLISEKTKYGSILVDIIRGVSKQAVTTQGKNIIDTAKFKKINIARFTDTTITPSSGTISGTATSTGGEFCASIEINIVSGKIYTISCTSNTNTSFYGYSDALWGTNVFSSAGSTVKTFTATYTGKLIIGIFVNVSTAPSAYSVTGIQMEEGSSKTSYAEFVPNSPSPDYPSDITSLGTYNASTTKYEFDVVENGKNFFNGNYTLNKALAGSTGAISTYNGRAISDYIYLKAGTYTISLSNHTATTNYLRLVCLYDKSKTFVKTINFTGTPSQQTIVLDADYYAIIMFVINDGIAISSVTFNTQIELGSTATTFDSYKGNKFTISLDNELRNWDYIYRSGSKFYVRKYTPKVTIASGMTTANYVADSTNGFKTVQVQLETFTTTSALTVCESMSNAFLGVTSQTANNTVLCQVSSAFGGIRATFRIPYTVTEVTDATTFLTYLISKGTYVLYKSVNYTDVALGTNNTYNMLSLLSNDGTTNVYINDSLNPSVTVEVPKTTTAGMTLKSFCDANRPNYEIDVTLATGTWNGTTAPYSYVITNNNINGRNVEILPASMTDAQAVALNKTMISNPTMDVSTNKITLKAYGVKPTINIPIKLSFKGVV